MITAMMRDQGLLFRENSGMKKVVLITWLLIVVTTTFGWADDTEIYGTVTNPDLEPNILIVFDSSGTSSVDILPEESITI